MNKQTENPCIIVGLYIIYTYSHCGRAGTLRTCLISEIAQEYQSESDMARCVRMCLFI